MEERGLEWCVALGYAVTKVGLGAALFSRSSLSRLRTALPSVFSIRCSPLQSCLLLPCLFVQ